MLKKNSRSDRLIFSEESLKLEIKNEGNIRKFCALSKYSATNRRASKKINNRARKDRGSSWRVQGSDRLEFRAGSLFDSDGESLTDIAEVTGKFLS